MFFTTKIHISINGWIAEPIQQARGLRQGDPLSPLLFNIAFEPMLRSILTNKLLQGINIPDTPHWQSTTNLATSSDIRVKFLAYADDLVVFIRSPQEWEILKKLLDQYSKTSNAKINLSKTTVLSLTGKPHQQWIGITQEAGIAWHDNSHTSPAIYLGYPLYSNTIQLNNFLTNVSNKIQRHIHILQNRQLSVKGKAIVCNSLLLSKLWHIIRVTIVPSKWLQEINTMIRDYILPFYPRPSLNYACQPQEKGGLGLIHLEDQYLALHTTYLKSLLSDQRPNPLTGVINVLIRLHTGHHSVLPFLMAPKQYISKVKQIPHLRHIAQLIHRLPQITPDKTWPPRTTRFIPIWQVLHSTSPENATAIKQKAPWAVVKDIHQYEEISGTYQDHINADHTKHKNIWEGIQDYSYQWDPLLQAQIIGKYTRPTTTSPTWFNILSLDHWKITVPPHKRLSKPLVLEPYNIKPSYLRHVWANEEQDSRGLPATRIPYALPSAMEMTPGQWRKFWKTKMKHQVRTVWWRLLIKKLPNQEALRHIRGDQINPGLCKICELYIEDDYHMIYDCSIKPSYWTAARYMLDMKTNTDIWKTLNFKQPTDKNHMINIGEALYALWTTHWSCIIDNYLWDNTFTLRQLRRQLWHKNQLEKIDDKMYSKHVSRTLYGIYG
jgi:hypothetical protein